MTSGLVKAARDNPNRALHRFLGPNEAGGSATFERELLDERDVEIRAHSEREQPPRFTRASQHSTQSRRDRALQPSADRR